MIYKDVEDASYKLMASPDYWLSGKCWGARYAYSQEWRRLLCGTTTRYDWLSSRGRRGVGNKPGFKFRSASGQEA